MIAWLIIYIIGVLLVGGVLVWYIKEADCSVVFFVVDCVDFCSVCCVSVDRRAMR